MKTARYVAFALVLLLCGGPLTQVIHSQSGIQTGWISRAT